MELMQDLKNYRVIVGLEIIESENRHRSCVVVELVEEFIDLCNHNAFWLSFGPCYFFDGQLTFLNKSVDIGDCYNCCVAKYHVRVSLKELLVK